MSSMVLNMASATLAPKHPKVLNNFWIGVSAAPLNAFICAIAANGLGIVAKRNDLTPANPFSMNPTNLSSRNKVICPDKP